MFGRLLRELNGSQGTPTANTMKDVSQAVNGTKIAYTLQSTNRTTAFDLSSGIPASFSPVPLALPNTGDAIDWVTTNKAVVMSFNVNTPFLVDYSLSTVTALGATGFALNASTKGQTIAGNMSTGVAMALAFSGGFVKVDSAGPTATALTNSSGVTPSCIIVKPGTSSWIVGGSNGKFCQLDAAGNATSVTTLPTTPSNSVSPTAQNISHMAMDAGGSELFLSTTSGMLFHYSLVGPTFFYNSVTRIASSVPTTTDGVPLSNIVNGWMMHCQGDHASSVVPAGIWLRQIGRLPHIPADSIYLPSTNINIRAVGINPTANVGWIATTQGRIFVIDMTGLATTIGKERAQDPVGVDVAARLITIQKFKYSMYRVESDISILAGPNNVALDLEDHEYLSVASINTPFVNEKIDIRQYSS